MVASYVLIPGLAAANVNAGRSNPFLWASQYLGEHVDMEFVVENPEKILEILQQIKLSASGVFRQEAMSKLAEIVSI